LLLASSTVAQAAAPAAERAPGGETIRVLVAADEESALAAQMTGTVVAVNAKLGWHIGAGQALVQFDCKEPEAHLKMAQAEFYGAQQTYESKIKLQAMQSVGELEVQQAAAAAEKFKAQIQLYQAQLKYCTVKAPFSGRVTKLRVKAFESVAVGQPLLEVVNDRKLKLQLNVPSAWLAQLKVGAVFAVHIDETAKDYEARVQRINGRVDAVSQSVEIEGELRGNAADLLPGMSGTASFQNMPKR